MLFGLQVFDEGLQVLKAVKGGVKGSRWKILSWKYFPFIRWKLEMPGNSQKGLWWKILPWKDVSLLHMEMPGQSQKMGSCTLITSQVAD